MQEKRIAEDIRGRVQPGSGNTWHSKADARAILNLRVEAKFTDKDSYILKLEDLLALEDAAIRGGLEDWAMQVEFPLFKRTFAIINYTYFTHLQKTTGRQLCQAANHTTAKQAKVPVNEVIWLAGNAAVNDLDWCFCFTFQYDGKWEKTYALIDWDEFLLLREASKSCQSATSSELSKTSLI